MKVNNCLLLKEKGGSVLLSRFAVTHTSLIRWTYKGREILILLLVAGQEVRVPQPRSHYWAWPRVIHCLHQVSYLGISELVINRSQLRFNDVPSQLL